MYEDERLVRQRLAEQMVLLKALQEETARTIHIGLTPPYHQAQVTNVAFGETLKLLEAALVLIDALEAELGNS